MRLLSHLFCNFGGKIFLLFFYAISYQIANHVHNLNGLTDLFCRIFNILLNGKIIILYEFLLEQAYLFQFFFELTFYDFIHELGLAPLVDYKLTKYLFLMLDIF